MADSPRKSVASLHARLALLYLASGMPLALVTETLPAFLEQRKASLADVGRIPGRANLLWGVKFLWGPLVDRARRRRRWIAGAQVGLALVLGAVALASAGAGIEWLWPLLLVLGFAAATQDLAADGWTIETVAKKDLGPANSVRVGAYRIGMALGGGFLLWAAADWGWVAAFSSAAVLYLLFAAVSTTLPERDRPRPQGPPLVPALRRLAARPAFLGAAVFVFLFKVGDYSLAAMVRPFQLRAGLSLYEIRDLVWIGMGATIAGVALGGVLTKRWGSFRALWILGLLQAASNLAFAYAAADGSRAAIYAAGVVEPFCGGLGTAPFLTVLMEVCEPRHAATQFAFWTGIMALGRWACGEAAGFLAASLGFALYFLMTAAMALPAYALLPWLRRYRRAEPAET